MSATPEPTTVEEPDSVPPETALRRSSRRSKPSVRAEQAQDRAESEIPVEQLTIHVNSPRRNPKRKASEATKSTVNLPDKPLEEALSPLCQQDIEEWEGWIELESEPVNYAPFSFDTSVHANALLEAFFNIILKDLGVENVKAQEVFSIDQDSLDLLPWAFSSYLMPVPYLTIPGNRYMGSYSFTNTCQKKTRTKRSQMLTTFGLQTRYAVVRFSETFMHLTYGIDDA